MTDDVLLLDKRDDGTAWLTLNRPHVLNAANLAVRDALWDALAMLRDDPDIRCGVVRGAGRAFCAGADISEFGTAPSYVEARRARTDRDVWARMLALPKPLVAAIHGYAYGAGCEMALCCDIRIASEDATFALPEVALGYIPSAGGTQTLPRTVPPGVARAMIFSGEPIDAQRALAIGLVTRVVPRDQLEGAAADTASRLASMPAAAVAATKEALALSRNLPLEEGLRRERAIAARLAGTPS